MMSSRLRVRSAFLAATAFGVLTLAAMPASAQSGFRSDRVDVDLSVLEDNGMSPGTAAVSPSYRGGKLLMPGPRQPKSQFLGGNLMKSGGAAPTAASRTPTAQSRSTFTPPPQLAKPKVTPPSRPFTAPEPPKMAAPAPMAPPAEPKMASAPPPPPSEPAPKKTAPKPLTMTKPAAEAPTAPPPPPAPAPTVAKTSAPPPPSIAKVEAPKPTQTASKPPETKKPASTASADRVRVAFPATASKLPSAAHAGLDELISALAADESIRVQLMAYAGGEDLSPSKARRLSLSRALAVRSYLIEKGVRSTRIDVRALGNKTDEDPKNRVDVEVAGR